MPIVYQYNENGKTKIACFPNGSRKSVLNYYLNVKLHSLRDETSYSVQDDENKLTIESRWKNGKLSRNPEFGPAYYMHNNGEIIVIYALDGKILENSYRKPRDINKKYQISQDKTIKSLKELECLINLF